LAVISQISPILLIRCAVLPPKKTAPEAVVDASASHKTAGRAGVTIAMAMACQFRHDLFPGCAGRERGCSPSSKAPDSPAARDAPGWFEDGSVNDSARLWSMAGTDDELRCSSRQHDEQSVR
jgi:hypothetical protein